MTDPAGTYHYALPPELIAERPAARRSASRLLVCARDGSVAGEGRFADLPRWLRPGDLLVLNDSRVLPARLLLYRPTGGRVEILLVRPAAAGGWLAMARPLRRLATGTELAATPGGEPLVRIAGRRDDGHVRVVAVAGDLLDLAHRYGRPPLPPYIVRRRRELGLPETEGPDRERYQTVYARDEGSVAAPTAGLHFEPELLDRLRASGVGTATVTLHVGPGTFQPPDEEAVRTRRLHPEVFHCPAATLAAVARTRRAGGRVVAVGTTTLRVLETIARYVPRAWPQDGPQAPPQVAAADGVPPVFTGEVVDGAEGIAVRGVTRLFLAPPDRVTAADALVTNFHLPGSSLLMLVACLLPGEAWRRAYAHAVAARYRFYSYGDAMLVLPPGEGEA